MLRSRVSFLGFRESPRPRRYLPPLVVLLLRPFFRYSDWRDAWILRIVGERYGPVVRSATTRDGEPFARRSPRFRMLRLRRPAAVHAPTALLVAGGIALAAALGYVIAASAGGGSSSVALGNPVSAAGLTASFPDGWRVRRGRDLPQRGLLDVIGASSGGRTIEVGTARTTDPSLLPASILGSLRAAPAPELVTLHGTTFYRYSRLSMRRPSGSESIYAVPTPSGTVLAVLELPRPDASLAGTFQRVVESIRLRSGSLSPGIVPAYATALAGVIDRLNTARARWSSQLTTAQTARRQAIAARRLASAHTQAAAALAGQDPGPARAANAAVVAALRGAAGAYSALARAAAGGRPSDYQLASAAVADANATLSSALTPLRRFGYLVG
jgi:hypothetical protein